MLKEMIERYEGKNPKLPFKGSTLRSMNDSVTGKLHRRLVAIDYLYERYNKSPSWGFQKRLEAAASQYQREISNEL